MIPVSRAGLTALAATFSAYQIVIGVLTLDVPAAPGPVLVALAVFGVVAVLVLLPYGDAGMPTWIAALALSSSVVITLLVTSQLDPGRHNGFATWHANAVGILLTVLVVRAHPVMAVLGVLFFSAQSVAWAGVAGAAQVGATGPIAWVVLAIVLTRAFHRAHADAESLLLAEREAVQWEAAQHAHLSERRARLDAASLVAGPLLRDVVISGGRLSAAEREEARILEAGLRDEIRGRRLLDDRVRAAVSDARRRGITVSLLDEGTIDEMPEDDRSRVLGVVADAIASVKTERLIVRTAPADGEAAVTVVGLSAPAPGSGDTEDDVDLWLAIPRRI